MDDRTLGHYQLIEKIGAGGMGEVWRGRDTRLHRDVAIKLLPEAMFDDEERLARFEREARVLAQLSHHHVAQIHDVDQVGERCFLVLELALGEPLSLRLSRGPLSVRDALDVCRQIAEALEAAHEAGIIHRDLKPANVCVTEGGMVKVLDFGLAKAAGDASGSGSSFFGTDAGDSDSLDPTSDGVVLGTPTYMSPEQARGRGVDRRTDVWAFGCVLYECLTGCRAFPGDTATDALGAVLHTEPDWGRLPDELPDTIVALLERCLVKDPRQRQRDAGDIRLELERALQEGFPSTRTASARGPLLAGTGRRRGGPQWGIAVLAAVMGVVIGVVAEELFRGGDDDEAAVVRFAVIDPPVAAATLGSAHLALSPDGTVLVYSGLAERPAARRLYMRRLDAIASEPLPGTEGGYAPFFSPDGNSIGYFTQTELRRLSLASGSSQLVAPVLSTSRGACWAPDDTIWFTPSSEDGLWRVPAGGGDPELVTVPDAKRGERTHRWPQSVHDGRALLYTVGTKELDSYDDARIVLRDLESDEEHVLVEGGTFGRLSPDGRRLLYARDGVLLALDLDRSGDPEGQPVSVLPGVFTDPHSGVAEYAVGADGMLVYARADPWVPGRRLHWIDRQGQRTPASEQQRPYIQVDLSPDGRSALVSIDGATSQVWLLDLARDSLTRLTLEWTNMQAVWAPDSRRALLQSRRSGVWGLYLASVDEPGVVELMRETEHPAWPCAITGDGGSAIVARFSPATGRDILVYPLDDATAEPRVLLQSAFDESDAQLSPDGRWLVYTSDESGRREVYVVPYQRPGRKLLLSDEGGGFPRWSPAGDEVFFVRDDALYAVAVPAGADSGELQPGRPTHLFDVDMLDFSLSFAVAADGQGFLVLEDAPPPEPAPIIVVRGWDG